MLTGISGSKQLWRTSITASFKSAGGAANGAAGADGPSAGDDGPGVPGAGAPVGAGFSGWFVVIGVGPVAPTLFRRDGCRRAGERRLHRVPAERRALDAHRALGDARERRELPEALLVALADGLPRHEVVERAEEGLDLLEPPAPDRLGHQRAGRLRDRAALAQERRVGDRPVLDAEEHGHAVAA